MSLSAGLGARNRARGESQRERGYAAGLGLLGLDLGVGQSSDCRRPVMQGSRRPAIIHKSVRGGAVAGSISAASCLGLQHASCRREGTSLFVPTRHRRKENVLLGATCSSVRGTHGNHVVDLAPPSSMRHGPRQRGTSSYRYCAVVLGMWRGRSWGSFASQQHVDVSRSRLFLSSSPPPGWFRRWFAHRERHIGRGGRAGAAGFARL